MDAIDAICDRLITNCIADEGSIQGCADEEVADVVADQGVVLPRLYERFLQVMGRGAGSLLRGSDVFYPAILGLRDAAKALLSESNEPFQLPPNALVFFMHQGYQFLYLDAEGGDDPPVSHFVEGWERPKLAWNHFTDFLNAEAAAEVTRRKSRIGEG